MSIIYDALKKVQTSHQEPLKDKAEQSKPKPKPYLLYVLVIGLGVLIASIFFGLFTPKSSSKEPLLAKNPSVAGKYPATNISPPLPKEAPILETQKHPASPWVLNGIFFSDNQGYALINNRILKEGDVIEGAKVVRVTLEGVELESEGKVVELSTGPK